MKNLQKHDGSICVVFSAILVVILILSGSAPVFAEQKAAQVPEPAPDLSNVYIPALAQNYPESFREQLARDHFLVMRNTASWLGSYEYFTYMQTPIFISTDSVLHFQHILFSKLLQSTEENILVWRLEALSKQMFEESKAQLELLQGTPWEAAARTNLDFFQVGVLLLADGQEADIAAQGLSDNAAAELESIIAEDGIRISAIFSPEGEEPQMEDYSQYKTL